MSIEDDIAFLQAVPILQVLGGDALRIIAIGAENKDVQDGEILFQRGDASDAGYLILEGSFTLSAVPDDPARDMVAERGTLLGELALIKDMPRAVTATARESSTVMRIPRSLFLKMLEGYPQAAHRLREMLVTRTRDTMGEVAKVRSTLHNIEKKS
ncbi:MAG: cyclic nucleotide-binding domain-containing protein [Pseudorhodoplanes sp.]